MGFRNRAREYEKPGAYAPFLVQRALVLGACIQEAVMMMIAFITIKSSLVPLIEGLCAQIYFRFEISAVCSHLLLFFFVKEKTC